MDVTIYQASSSDAPAILNLYREYYTGDICIDRIQDLVQRYPSTKAMLGKKLIGFCYCERFSPDILQIANIYITSTARRAGVGKEFLSLIENQALDAGYEALIASNSTLYNTKDKKEDPEYFYIKRGFFVSARTNQTKIFFKSLI